MSGFTQHELLVADLQSNKKKIDINNVCHWHYYECGGSAKLNMATLVNVVPTSVYYR